MEKQFIEQDISPLPVPMDRGPQPGWPSLEKVEWFMGFAEQASKRSPDAETKVGSVLVNTHTGAVLAMGFNGFVRNAPDHRLPKTRPDKYKYIVHSEVNLVANCARHGISMANCEVYCTLSPCVNCMRTLFQCGITRVYIKEFYREFDEVKKMNDLHIEVTPYGPYFVLEYIPYV